MERAMLKPLPVHFDLETKQVLRRLPAAHAAMAELKVLAETLPDPNILINTLGLQEAKDSSAVENIITTHDELYKSELFFEDYKSLSAKEVQNYIAASKTGYHLLMQSGMLTNRTILQIQEILEANKAGYRKLPGTKIKNTSTGEIIYEPPQDPDTIIALMSNLEQFINDNEMCDYDPLIKMAIIHYQFESIHPFYDGNGRTGRIINLLYLILQNLQTLPILYLSNFIINNKARYYHLLHHVHNQETWEAWIVFMITCVETTARETIEKIKEIKKLMLQTKLQIRNNYKFYSPELIHNLFKHPYTKIEFVVHDLGVTRLTAATYLNKLAADKILVKQKLGTGNYYINQPLFDLLTNGK